MNGINGVAGPPALWSQASTQDGRVYYYNTQTKVTQWTKPLELMGPAEVSRVCFDKFPFMLTEPASSCQPAMEGAYYARGQKVLVQHGVEAELVGDARGLQNCNCADCPYTKARCTVRYLFVLPWYD